MSQGIFHVNFKSSTQDFGDGLVVIKDGKANGGDGNYLYQGSVPDASGEFSSQFSVSKWRSGNSNVVGIDNYTLNAKGFVDYEKGTIALKGAVVGAEHLTITLDGKKVANAV